MGDAPARPRTVADMRKVKVDGQLSLFGLDDAEQAPAAVQEHGAVPTSGEATAQREGARTVQVTAGNEPADDPSQEDSRAHHHPSLPLLLCGRESATALIALCAGCLSAATEFVRGVLVEERLSIDVEQLMEVAQRGDGEASSEPEILKDDLKLIGGVAVASQRAQLLWSLAARLAAAEQQIAGARAE
jgi:hypothetical protein